MKSGKKWKVTDLPVTGEVPFSVMRMDGMNNKANVITLGDGSLWLASYDSIVACWRNGDACPHLTVPVDSGLISATTIRHIRRFVEIAEAKGFEWK